MISIDESIVYNLREMAVEELDRTREYTDDNDEDQASYLKWCEEVIRMADEALGM